MNSTVRRSWLPAPLSNEEGLLQGARSGADVVVLDLVELVREEDKPAARQDQNLMPSVLEAVEVGATEGEAMDVLRAV